MNCPVCAKSLAPTLSICPACGAMMNDSVREEMQVMPAIAVRVNRTAAAVAVRMEAAPVAPSPVPRKVETASLRAPKTSPTLVGFQNKNTPIPEWRLQMQNAVQKRRDEASGELRSVPQYPTNGSAALKIEPAVVVETEPHISDPRVAAAIKRIEQSRKSFQEKPAPVKTPQKPIAVRPFNLVPPTSSAAAAAPARIVDTPRPKLVAPVVEKRDTNKLPLIDYLAFELPKPIPTEREKITTDDLTREFAEIKRIRIRADKVEIPTGDLTETTVEDIEDLAPFSMRFGAGLFDMIIAGFASLLLLSPIAFSGTEWLNGYGGLAIAGTFVFATFIYMTICLGFFGKTMGMRLFSLELVDAAENEYPSLQQAAVNSLVFIISLAFAGAGFLTVFFNEERRALHDLLSGTILVREF